MQTIPFSHCQISRTALSPALIGSGPRSVGMFHLFMYAFSCQEIGSCLSIKFASGLSRLFPSFVGDSKGQKLHLNGCRLRGSNLIGRAQWLENSAEVEVAAPLEKCWDLWEDQERIPNWMPWISSVKASYCPMSHHKLCLCKFPRSTTFWKI